MTLLLVEILWLSFGMAMGFLIDHRQMQRPVPYAELSATFPLKWYRVLVVILCTLFGIPLLIRGFIDAVFEEFRKKKHDD